jgi:ubiquinone/menaquinone biosynthesis C-methylase UbiE
MPCPSWASWLVEDTFLEALWGPFAGSRLLIERAGVADRMSVLDAGCGVGRVAIPAAKRVGQNGKVTALDIQEGMLKKLKERVQAEGVTNIETILGGLGHGLLDKNRYDRCFLITVLGEIPKSERMAALREIFESLKPGGVLSVTEVFLDPHHQRRKTVLGMVQAEGFSVAQQYGNWSAFTINFMKPTPRRRLF